MTAVGLLESKKTWLALLLIGLVAVYLPGLRGELIFDDQILIDGTVFRDYGFLTDLTDIRQRWLSYGSFVWFHELLGEGWWKQRVVNLLLHLCVAAILFLLVRVLVDEVQWPLEEPKPDPSLIARSKDAAVGFGVLVFALNPVAAYAVAYLVQRSIVMATLFSVLCLYLTALAAKRDSVGLLLGAAMAYLAALLSKGHVVMLPLVALAVFLLAGRFSSRKAWILAGGALLLTVASAGFLAMSYGAMVGKAFDADSEAYIAQLDVINPGFRNNAFLLSIVNQAWLFGRYGLIWLFPNVGWMSIDLRPVFPLTFTGLPHVLGLPLYLGIAIGSVIMMSRFGDWRRFLGFGLFAPAVLFVTEFGTVWIQDPFVLYRSYLWAIGVPILVSTPFVGARPRTIAITAIVVGAVLAALTVERVLSLNRESTAWADAAEKVDTMAPAGAVGRWRALMHRGNQYLLRQRFQAALADFEAASRLGDPTGLTYYHRGLVLQRLGRRDEALLAFSEAGKARAVAHGVSGLPHYESGKLLFSMGRYSEAIAELDLALKALEDPDERLTALKIRAQSNARSGRAGDAVSDYRRALEINPAERSTRIGLALALIGNGQGKEAIAVLNAVQGESDGWDVRLGRAMAYEAMGLREKAIEEARVALGMNRGNSALQTFARKLGLKP